MRWWDGDFFSKWNEQTGGIMQEHWQDFRNATDVWWQSCCQQPLTGHGSVWLGVFWYNCLKPGLRMLYLLKSHFANWSTWCLFPLPSSLHLSFCPPLSKVRHQWMAFDPCRSALHKQPELVESTLYWALCSFNFCVIIAFTNIIRNPLLAIMDLYSIAGSHLSHQVTLPGLLDILDNTISSAHAIIIFRQHTLWMISKYTHAIFRQDASRQRPAQVQ